MAAHSFEGGCLINPDAQDDFPLGHKVCEVVRLLTKSDGLLKFTHTNENEHSVKKVSVHTCKGWEVEEGLTSCSS